MAREGLCLACDFSMFLLALTEVLLLGKIREISGLENISYCPVWMLFCSNGWKLYLKCIYCLLMIPLQ